jgi:hypothetical protein
LCSGCRSTSATSSATIDVSINPTHFEDFFNHEGERGERLTLGQRFTIVALHSLEIGDSLIAQLTHCDLRTIQHWINVYQNNHDLQDEPRTGRPRVTTEDIDTSIVAAATETPMTTPRIIRSELGVDASTRTVRRRLDEAGLFGRVARIEYPFTEDHVAKRLEFACNRILYRDIEDDNNQLSAGAEFLVCWLSLLV